MVRSLAASRLTPHRMQRPGPLHRTLCAIGTVDLPWACSSPLGLRRLPTAAHWHAPAAAETRKRTAIDVCSPAAVPMRRLMNRLARDVQTLPEAAGGGNPTTFDPLEVLSR